MNNFMGRLNYSEDLKPVINRICDTFGVGQLTNFSIIENGYEDCNVFIETSRGRYVTKIFSKIRSQSDIDRYVGIMEKVLEAEISHPKLIKNEAGGILYVDQQSSGIRSILMEFVDGKSFVEIGRSPNKNELGAIIEQAVKINRIDYNPPYIFDSWAIPNIQVMFDKVKRLIEDPDDILLVEKAIEKYNEIPLESLPRCFVHGDFTKANVLKGTDDKIYIIDFSVANWYPRIQELAVIVGNLLYDEKEYTTLDKRVELILREYGKLESLTQNEKKYLYHYSLAGVAMEFFGAYQEKFINGNDTEETNYWMSLGRNSLRKELL